MRTAEVVQGLAFVLLPHRAGVHRSALRIPAISPPPSPSGLRAALYLRRVPGPGGHWNYLQPLVLHGPHHGDRIVAKNGILLLDADQKFRAAGIPAEESMMRAGERRLASHYDDRAGPPWPACFRWRSPWAGSQMLQPLAMR